MRAMIAAAFGCSMLSWASERATIAMSAATPHSWALSARGAAGAAAGASSSAMVRIFKFVSFISISWGLSLANWRPQGSCRHRRQGRMIRPWRRRLMKVAAFLLSLCSSLAHAQNPSSASNMALVGSHDLQARSAYQPLVVESRGRFLAYVGHHGGKSVNPLTGNAEDNGTSILDVTDPRQPRMLSHIPGEPGLGESGGAQMVRVCNGKDLPKGDPAKTYMLRPYGNLAQEVWDVTLPEKPVRLAVLVDKLK